MEVVRVGELPERWSAGLPLFHRMKLTPGSRCRRVRRLWKERRGEVRAENDLNLQALVPLQTQDERPMYLVRAAKAWIGRATPKPTPIPIPWSQQRHAPCPQFFKSVNERLSSTQGRGVLTGHFFPNRWRTWHRPQGCPMNCGRRRCAPAWGGLLQVAVPQQDLLA